ncbi:MAG: hypothetical protein JW959_06745 [Pirellulales bacterium]|nr:hypothetical protein [Pirellulales bacterium]
MSIKIVLRFFLLSAAVFTVHYFHVSAQAQTTVHESTSAALPPGINFGLGGLPLITDARTRSISPENPTGEKGKGAMAVPRLNDPDLPHAKSTFHLGRGWKTRPFLAPKAGETKESDDIASVAYWYQSEPHAAFPPLPPVAERTRDAVARRKEPSE